MLYQVYFCFINKITSLRLWFDSCVLEGNRRSVYECLRLTAQLSEITGLSFFFSNSCGKRDWGTPLEEIPSAFFLGSRRKFCFLNLAASPPKSGYQRPEGVFWSRSLERQSINLGLLQVSAFRNVQKLVLESDSMALPFSEFCRDWATFQTVKYFEFCFQKTGILKLSMDCWNPVTPLSMAVDWRTFLLPWRSSKYLIEANEYGKTYSVWIRDVKD